MRKLTKRPGSLSKFFRASVSVAARIILVLLTAYLFHLVAVDVSNRSRKSWLDGLRKAVPMVDGASGFMVKWDDTKKEGYILTAYHVVEDRFHDKKPVIIEYLGENLEHKQGEGEIVYWDKAKDLALIKTNTKFPILSIMSDKAYERIDQFNEVIAVGFPKEGNIHSQFRTDGYVVNPKHSQLCSSCKVVHGGLTHDAGIWYGFSGGPAVDVDSRKVVGVNIRFGPSSVNVASLALSTKAPEINKFLSEYWATK